MPQTNTLLVQNLTIGYEATKIGSGYHFELEAGSLVGLIGENGIGKSTLLKTIAGLLAPIQGQVLVNGKDVFTHSVQQRARQLALVLTQKFDAGYTTVEEMVALGRYAYTNWQFKLGTKDKFAIENAIEMVALTAYKNHLFEHLSDGNKQKVLIAQALAKDTPILILDEPTVHLDIKNRFIVLDLLQQISSTQNKLILFSGHDLEQMVGLCDKLLLQTHQGITLGTPNYFLENKLLTKAFNLEENQLPFVLKNK